MEMVEVKTAELSGAALDWSVKQAIGAVDEPGHIVQFPDWHPVPWMMGLYKPSTEWDHAGPLIKEYAIGFVGHDADNWLAFFSPEDKTHEGIGSTHLIAACRAIVAAKLGDTVSVPKELLP